MTLPIYLTYNIVYSNNVMYSMTPLKFYTQNVIFKNMYDTVEQTKIFFLYYLTLNTSTVKYSMTSLIHKKQEDMGSIIFFGCVDKFNDVNETVYNDGFQ